MNKIDKIIFIVLGLMGTSVDIIKFIIQYELGLVWIVYSFIRKQNYKKRFSKLNKGAKQQLKWIIDDIEYYFKKESK